VVERLVALVHACGPVAQHVAHLRRIADPEAEIDVGPRVPGAVGRGAGHRASGETRVRAPGFEQLRANPLAILSSEHGRARP
jgi:hypothetical protein